jgi:uncharacterized protein YuzE
MPDMLIEYDPEADVAFMTLIAEPGHTAGKMIDEHRIVHYDDEGRPAAVEFLFASRGVDVSGLPEAERIADALRAFPRLVS